MSVHTVRFCLVVCLVLTCATVCFSRKSSSSTAANCVAQADESWMGVYVIGKKVGDIHDVSAWHGKGSQAIYESREEMHMSLSLLGKEFGCDVITVSHFDSQHRPIYANETSISPDPTTGGKSRKVITARYGAKTVECETDVDGRVTKESVPIPPGVDLSAPDALDFENVPLVIGKSRKATTFNLDQMAFVQTTSKITGREKIKVNGRSYDSYTVSCQEAGAQCRIWISKNGGTIKLEIPVVGGYAVTETPAEAASGQ